MTSKGTEKMSEITIGVDISKDALDAHRLPDGASRSFANTPAGQKALIAWAGHGVTRIVFEPTGPYHAAFERALARAGLPGQGIAPHAVLNAERTGLVTLSRFGRIRCACQASEVEIGIAAGIRLPHGGICRQRRGNVEFLLSPVDQGKAFSRLAPKR